MIYLVPGRQNLSIISLFPTASQETACLFNAVFVKVYNVVCEDQKEGGRGSVTPPPPLKNPNLSNLHVKITLPPPSSAN